MVHSDRDATLRVSFKADRFQGKPVMLTAEQSTLTQLAKVTEGRDTRVIGVGVKAFMACRESDLQSRIRFMEEVGLGYATAAAGVTESMFSDIVSLTDTPGEAGAAHPEQAAE
jgi:hypothetical protein